MRLPYRTWREFCIGAWGFGWGTSGLESAKESEVRALVLVSMGGFEAAEMDPGIWQGLHALVGSLVIRIVFLFFWGGGTLVITVPGTP